MKAVDDAAALCCAAKPDDHGSGSLARWKRWFGYRGADSRRRDAFAASLTTASTTPTPTRGCTLPPRLSVCGWAHPAAPSGRRAASTAYGLSPAKIVQTSKRHDERRFYGRLLLPAARRPVGEIPLIVTSAAEPGGIVLAGWGGFWRLLRSDSDPERFRHLAVDRRTPGRDRRFPDWIQT